MAPYHLPKSKESLTKHCKTTQNRHVEIQSIWASWKSLEDLQEVPKPVFTKQQIERFFWKMSGCASIICQLISLLVLQISIPHLLLQAWPFLRFELVHRPSRPTKVLVQHRSNTQKELPVTTTISGVNNAIRPIPDTLCNQRQVLRITSVHAVATSWSCISECICRPMNRA